MSAAGAQADAAQVAIVHDYLTQRGGAERVVLALARAFPDSPIVTSLYDRVGTFAEFERYDVRTSPLQRWPWLRRHHRAGLPLYPFAFGRFHVRADVVICSTSGWAHGVKTDGAKLLYVNNPARWLYQGDEYFESTSKLRKAAFLSLSGPLRTWDRTAAHSADRILVNSRAVHDRVQEFWGLESTVLYPPHGVDPSAPQDAVAGLKPGFLLTVARLLPYKHVESVSGAMTLLPSDSLVVVGDGPLGRQLRELAPPNVRFIPRVSDAELRWLYSNARLLVAAATEDLGLAPLEAMAFGTPVVALRRGGYLETVVEGATGVFFDDPQPAAISRAVREADCVCWEADRLRARAAEFSEEAFTAGIRAAVAELAQRRSPNA